METKHKNLKNIFFPYILVLSIIIVSGVSFYRFFIKHDYVVGYEGVCDTTINKCFIGCDDDACTEEYYYSEMEKYAPDLYAECGKDITDCEEANICLSNDLKCSVVYCDPEIEMNQCTELNDQIGDNQDGQIDSTEEDNLQDNFIEQ